MLMVFALIGAKALYFLFLWLISAALAAWVADRKGYGERVGLTFGLILSAVGLILVLLLPGRPGSKWREEGWVPRRRRGGGWSGGPQPSGQPPGHDVPDADHPD